MSSTYAIEVQHEDEVRRLSLGADAIDVGSLETSICHAFEIDPTSQLSLTYTGKDGDVVTIADDNDLKDALVVQSINPLRLSISSIRRRAPSPKPATSTGDGNDPLTTENAASRDEVTDPSGFGSTGTAPTSLGNQGPAASDDPATGSQEHSHRGIQCAMCHMLAPDGQQYKSKSIPFYICKSCYLRNGCSPDDFYEVDPSISDHAKHYPSVRGKSITAGGSPPPPLSGVGEAPMDIPTQLDSSQSGSVTITREPAGQGKSVIMHDGQPAPPCSRVGEDPKDIPTRLDDHVDNITPTRTPVWQGKSIIMHGDKPAPPWCGSMGSPKDIPTQLDDPASIQSESTHRHGKSLPGHGPTGEPPRPADDSQTK